MISPFTPAGVKVVCVEAADRKYALPFVSYNENGPWLLKAGEVYTVVAISEACWTRSQFVVSLMEVPPRAPGDPGYDIARFRLAELPKAILDCLNVQPIDTPELVPAGHDDLRGRAGTPNSSEPGLSRHEAGAASVVTESHLRSATSLSSSRLMPSTEAFASAFLFSLQSFNTRQDANPSVMNASALSSST